MDDLASEARMFLIRIFVFIMSPPVNPVLKTKIHQ